jgi:hypothetical protein
MTIEISGSPADGNLLAQSLRIAVSNGASSIFRFGLYFAPIAGQSRTETRMQLEI